jgi:hypothetical protein
MEKLYNEELYNEIRRALNLVRAEGVEGWGLENPDPELFHLAEVGGPIGCTSETCNHWSHDPAAPVNKLVSHSGWAVSSLGSCADERRAGYVEFFITWRGDAARVWRLDEPGQYWARMAEIRASELPAWALARLMEEALA